MSDTREVAIVEMQTRINLIKEANGYFCNVARCNRNPQDTPRKEVMPLIDIFEGADRVIDMKLRGASKFPSYKREMVVSFEMWYASESEGESSHDIRSLFLAFRQALWTGGTTLGGKVQQFIEVDMTPVVRMPVSRNLVGLGVITRMTYIDEAGG